MSEKPSSLRIMLAQPLCEDAMRLLPLMLLVVCCSVRAEWVFVDKTDRADHYVDLEAGQRRGDFVEAWQLTNLFSPDGDGTRSRRGLEQHDCKNRKWRLLHLSMHLELWAKGTPKLIHLMIQKRSGSEFHQKP